MDIVAGAVGATLDPPAVTDHARPGAGAIREGPDPGAMDQPFPGVLWPSGVAVEPDADPAEFHDLHLDDIVRAVLLGRAEYRLESVFRARAADVDIVEFRHEVFRDLERPEVINAVRAFATAMREVRLRLERMRTAHYRYERARWFLAAGATYADGVAALLDGLTTADPGSRGLRGLVRHLADYAAGATYRGLAADAARTTDALSTIRYRLRLEIGRLSVSAPADEPDFGAEILSAFERFRQGAGRTYPFEFPVSPDLHHVEDAVVERVALVFPDAFAALAEFTVRHDDFIDEGVARFDREVQYYVAWLEHTARIRRHGLAFCLPEVTAGATEFAGSGLFDLALAELLVREKHPVVTNDAWLRAGERILVVTGPNQGGKTTFARAIGQVHHLAAIGAPVPGAGVRVDLVDGIHTLFERQEAVEDLVGKLEDDLRRMHAILEVITPRSLVVMNETFSSTTVADQAFINERVVGTIDARGAWCVIVTFLDELARRGPSTVSMLSEVDPDDLARRTFRIVRRPADGLAYANAIAEKHGLTYQQIRDRIER